MTGLGVLGDRANVSGIETLESITLERLVAAAARQTRVDRKYLVTGEQARWLVDLLSDQARVLEIEGRRTFGYESVYHDTDDLVAYRLAAHKRRRRFKVLHRRYLDTGAAFVEVKTRGPREVTVKTREPSRAAGALDAADRAFVAAALEAAGFDVRPALLRPVLMTWYRRSTLYLPGDGARVTLDTGLTWRSGRGRSTRAALVVLETKSGAAPSEADRALWAAGQRPRTISKFGTGLALLDDSLPANKWHRTINRLGTVHGPCCEPTPTTPERISS